MGAETFTIRTMAPTEVPRALDWAAAEGWNPGLHDAEAFLAADPDGFLCGELNGQIVSCISAVRYGDDYGFMGFYIVRPEHRGRGFGYRTSLAGMARMGDRRVGLDGVLAQVDNYRKSKFAWSHRNARYSLKTLPPLASHEGVEDLSAFPWAEILAFDRTCFPAPRVAFLERSQHPTAGKALGFRDAGGRLAGYGVIRACRTGAKIWSAVCRDVGRCPSPLRVARRLGLLGPRLPGRPRDQRRRFGPRPGARHDGGLPDRAHVPRIRAESGPGADLRNHQLRVGVNSSLERC